jgi:hypothetical protein
MRKQAPVFLALAAALVAWVAAQHLHEHEPTTRYEVLQEPEQVRAFLK